jgi:hypothetical protein
VRLPAYLDERFTPPAPSIYSQIETKAIGGRQNLSFLIDTGASATTILGTVETRLINDGRLFFRNGSGETVAEKLTIYAAKHDQDRLDKHGKQLVMQLPCLLGRDILQRYRFVYDKPRQQVYLEK